MFHVEHPPSTRPSGLEVPRSVRLFRHPLGVSHRSPILLRGGWSTTHPRNTTPTASQDARHHPVIPTSSDQPGHQHPKPSRRAPARQEGPRPAQRPRVRPASRERIGARPRHGHRRGLVRSRMLGEALRPARPVPCGDVSRETMLILPWPHHRPAGRHRRRTSGRYRTPARRSGRSLSVRPRHFGFVHRGAITGFAPRGGPPRLWRVPTASRSSPMAGPPTAYAVQSVGVHRCRAKRDARSRTLSHPTLPPGQ